MKSQLKAGDGVGVLLGHNYRVGRGQQPVHDQAFAAAAQSQALALSDGEMLNARMLTEDRPCSQWRSAVPFRYARASTRDAIRLASKRPGSRVMGNARRPRARALATSYSPTGNRTPMLDQEEVWSLSRIEAAAAGLRARCGTRRA
jgi:hypothetical protein